MIHETNTTKRQTFKDFNSLFATLFVSLNYRTISTIGVELGEMIDDDSKCKREILLLSLCFITINT